jgi:SAM-dependent methyltransferase
MKSLRFLTLAVVLGFAATASAQAQQPFEPQSGQAGKDVVWVPTPQVLVERMLDLAKLQKGELHIDLGSGDGRTVITAAKRGATAIGVEFNPQMVELSRGNAKKEGVSDRATFVNGDLFEYDFSKANVLTLFLLPSINMRLRPTILDKMRPGTRVVSNTFTMEDWQADETSVVGGDCISWCTAHLWIVPAKVEGAWRLPQGTLTLKQNFQMLSGTLGSTPIADGRLRGDEISFTAGGQKYTGKVNGSTITGTSGSGAFTATKS